MNTNVEISPKHPKEDGGVQKPFLQKAKKTAMLLKNIQQLARVKPAFTVVWYLICQNDL